MSLLTLCQAAAQRLGITVPTSIVGSADTQTLQLLGLAQQEGRDLASRFNWQRLTKETTFTAVAQAEQTNAVPADFDRFVDGSMWNRTRDNLIYGPMTPQEWQAIQATFAPNIVEAFRLRGNALLITPTPKAGDTYAFEYVSTYWVAITGSTTGSKTEFSVDTDVALLDEELIGLGVTWRFLRSKGFDYSEAFRSYEMALKRRLSRDGGSPVVIMSGPPNWFGAPKARVPDGSWNL